VKYLVGRSFGLLTVLYSIVFEHSMQYHTFRWTSHFVYRPLALKQSHNRMPRDSDAVNVSGR
jgi:hypothetical protein